MLWKSRLDPKMVANCVPITELTGLSLWVHKGRIRRVVGLKSLLDSLAHRDSSSAETEP